MSGKVDSSTSVQDPVSQQSSSRVMSIAVIGPNESHRKVVSKALSGAPGRSFREFADYPARLSEIPRIVEQGFSVVMIDVDSDESYAIKIIEGFAAAESVMVMAYSQRNDPALVTSCMRAGAREFLPLPAPGPVAEAETKPTEVPERPVAASSSWTPPSTPPARPAQPAMAPPVVVPETRSGLPPLAWESEAIERENNPAPVPREAPKPELVNGSLESSPSQPDELADRPNSFDAWDAANLRFTQSANASQAPAPMRTPSPHELFARSRKAEPEAAVMPDPPKPIRPHEPSSRPAAAPQLLVRNEISRVPDLTRSDPTESAPSREKRAAPPLPHEMFLKNGPDGPSSSASADVPLDMFERPTRQVYKPSPQELTFSSLATDPDAERGKGGGMIWAFLAAGAGMLGCLAFLFFFFAHPSGSHPAPVPVATQPAAPVAAPKTSQPDVFDKEFATPAPGTTAKPSPRNAGALDDSASGANTSSVPSQMMDQQLAAQSKLSGAIKQPVPAEDAPTGFTPATMDGGAALPTATFTGHDTKVVPAGAAISGGVAEGLLLRRTPPVYPNIAKSARVEGTVVIGATITKYGTLTNLHVVSGPGMLREAAMDSVKSWRYRPYMLNNQPIDVDTSISVVFSLGK